MCFTPKSLTAHFKIELSDSVPPELKIISPGSQFKIFAIDLLDVSIYDFADLPKECIQIVPSESRDAATLMLEGLNGSIDVIVPRGGKSLVAEVERSAKVPVFGHLEGICHIYIDEHADEEKALAVCLNAKMRRTGICGAVETILVNDKIAESFVPCLLYTSPSPRDTA